MHTFDFQIISGIMKADSHQVTKYFEGNIVQFLLALALHRKDERVGRICS